ncbi:MarR family winged helix-turn-helix transcriptional regulator [Glycomyces niveus]|uniref:MarR family transcriptional regulator n=1 Tax=Glycomyces niveus TaxID=2820287 RepID=A0ABS3UD72_9ACTN|nr:MarR family transcriptional regulator [Glycomyces sp. NEAU-S30]MBO3735708.1 MarR family transcriptional regulator [Glycomyces sp. NEAU-S30]
MDEPDAALGVQIGGQMYLAHRYARAATNRALQEHGVELRHLGVLGQIAEAGPMSQRELIDRLQVDKSSMVHIVDELERQGLAERHRNERDRRSYTVHITTAGEERLKEAQASTAKVMTRLLKPLSAADRRQLQDLLARFIDNAARQE